jgi:hypothetical protein
LGSPITGIVLKALVIFEAISKSGSHSLKALKWHKQHTCTLGGFAISHMGLDLMLACTPLTHDAWPMHMLYI